MFHAKPIMIPQSVYRDLIKASTKRWSRPTLDSLVYTSFASVFKPYKRAAILYKLRLIYTLQTLLNILAGEHQLEASTLIISRVVALSHCRRPRIKASKCGTWEHRELFIVSRDTQIWW